MVIVGDVGKTDDTASRRDGSHKGGDADVEGLDQRRSGIEPRHENLLDLDGPFPHRLYRDYGRIRTEIPRQPIGPSAKLPVFLRNRWPSSSECAFQI